MFVKDDMLKSKLNKRHKGSFDEFSGFKKMKFNGLREKKW